MLMMMIRMMMIMMRMMMMMLMMMRMMMSVANPVRGVMRKKDKMMILMAIRMK